MPQEKKRGKKLLTWLDLQKRLTEKKMALKSKLEKERTDLSFIHFPVLDEVLHIGVWPLDLQAQSLHLCKQIQVPLTSQDWVNEK